MHSQNHPYKFVLDGGNESVTMWALYIIFPTITIISQHKLILFAGINCGKQMTPIRALLRIWWFVCAIFVARSTKRCVHNLKLNGAFFKDYPRLETSLFFCCLLFRLRTRFSFSFIEFFLLLSFFSGWRCLVNTTHFIKLWIWRPLTKTNFMWNDGWNDVEWRIWILLPTHLYIIAWNWCIDCWMVAAWTVNQSILIQNVWAMTNIWPNSRVCSSQNYEMPSMLTYPTIPTA